MKYTDIKKSGPLPQQAGTAKANTPKTDRALPSKSIQKYGAGYAGSGDPTSTQDRMEPIDGAKQAPVYQEMVIRPINREPKDVLTLQASIMAAESIYYPNQERLFDLYTDALRDGFLHGIIRKLIAQIINKNLLFLKGGEEVPGMDKLIASKAFKALCREILYTPFWGLNGMEFIPGSQLSWKPIPKKHIKPKTQLIAYEQWGLTEGIDYTQLWNVWILGDEHKVGGNGAERDLGLLYILSYYVLLKKGMISDWAQYIQIFGSPTIVIKYKGFDPQAKATADNIINNIGSFNRISLPEEMEFTPVEAHGSNGTGDLQEKFRHACNEEMAILVLGNTETTGHEKTGTGAKSKTHSEQQLEIIRDAMDYLVSALNTDHFQRILRSYGYPVDGGEFVFDKEVDIAYLKDYIPLITQLGTQLGLDISKSQLREITGLAKPKNADDTIQLFPTLGQQISNEPDTQDGQPAPKPAPKQKKPKTTPTAQAPDDTPVTRAEINAILQETLTAFFGPARS